MQVRRRQPKRYCGSAYGINDCPPGYANESGGAPTLADILVSVGTSTSPTSMGNKAVTGVGFGPKLVMPFSSFAINQGSETYINAPIFGAMSSDSQFAVGIGSRHAVTTSITNRRHTSSKCVSVVDPNGGAILAEAGYSSFNDDGFTLNWSKYDNYARILNHIALGGADLEVSITQHQMNGTNAAQSFAHGLSGAPAALIVLDTSNNNAPPNTSAGLWLSFGIWANNSQCSAQVYSYNALSTTTTRRMLWNDKVCGFSAGTTTNGRQMAVASVDTTNVNVTYPVSASAYQSRFFMIALRGCTAKVGTFDCNGSTDPLTIDCAGVRPKLFLPVFVAGGVDSVNTVQTGALLGIGASDGTNNVSCGITDESALTTTNARRYQSSTTLVEYGESGSKFFEAAATFDGESVILDPTTNAGTVWGQGAYLIIGN